MSFADLGRDADDCAMVMDAGLLLHTVSEAGELFSQEHYDCMTQLRRVERPSQDDLRNRGFEEPRIAPRLDGKM